MRTTTRDEAIGQLVVTAFFFAMRSCEYSDAGRGRITTVVTIDDVQFRKNGDTIPADDQELTRLADTVSIKAMMIQDIQEQLLLTVSAEDFTDPTTRSKLTHLTKEKGIQAILENTSVDALNHQVSVKYLYNLGENFYGATRRIKTLHNKISDKPEIAAEIDKYIQEQIDNGN